MRCRPDPAPMLFSDRIEAGSRLASSLARYANREDVVVLALPRGGVPVGFEVAQTLHVLLDVFLVRKLGVPGHPELAMGAIATGDVRVLSEDLIANLGSLARRSSGSPYVNASSWNGAIDSIVAIGSYLNCAAAPLSSSTMG